MEWEYVRLMSRNYLQVRIESRFETLFQYRMMISTSINGLLGCRTRELNGSSYLLYDISSMQSLSSLYAEKKMDFSMFYQLIYSLDRTVKNMKEYLLEGDNLLLYPEFIFQELDTKEINFICYPCVDDATNDSAKKLYDFLLSVINHDDEALTEMIYQLFERVEEEDGLPWIEDLYKKLSEVHEKREQERICELKEAGEIYQREKTEEDLQEEDFSGFLLKDNSNENLVKEDNRHWKRCKISLLVCVLYAAAVGFSIYYLYTNYILDLRENIITWIALVVITTVLAFWMFLGLKKGDKKILEPVNEEKKVTFQQSQEVLEERYIEDNSYGKTIYFEAEEIENKLYGIGKKNRRIIQLSKFPYTIGKKEDAVDGVLDEPSVSRVHARFYKENIGAVSVITMQDLNSTNGTYKNGIMLAPHEKVEVLPEDEIRFGKLQFIYR